MRGHRNRTRLLLAAAALAVSLLVPDVALAATKHAASHQSNAAVRWGLLIGIGGVDCR